MLTIARFNNLVTIVLSGFMGRGTAVLAMHSGLIDPLDKQEGDDDEKSEILNV